MGAAKLIVLALCIGFGLALVIANVRSWELEDANAYWSAAIRLRHAQPLYVAVNPSADEAIAYRYAPWLAWLWIPLTTLPKTLVQVGWSALLIGAVAGALLPLVRLRTPAAVCVFFLLGGLLVRTASTGNVHALVIALLVWGVPRRSGPIWVGVAASLKVAPLMYVLVYLRRREYGNVVLALLTFAVLMAPILLYNLSDYPTDVGDSLSLLSLYGVIPWAVGAFAAGIVAWLLARGRFAWPATSAATIAAIPRLNYYDLTYLLVGLPHEGSAVVPESRTQATVAASGVP